MGAPLAVPFNKHNQFDRHRPGSAFSEVLRHNISTTVFTQLAESPHELPTKEIPMTIEDRDAIRQRPARAAA